MMLVARQVDLSLCQSLTVSVSNNFLPILTGASGAACPDQTLSDSDDFRSCSADHMPLVGDFNAFKALHAMSH